MDIQKELELFLDYYMPNQSSDIRDAVELDKSFHVINVPKLLAVSGLDESYVLRLTDSWNAWKAAKAQAVQEWISVDDEPPTPNKTFSDAVIAWDGLCIRRIPLCLFNSASEVTHWMPIPQPPKAQEPAND